MARECDVRDAPANGSAQNFLEPPEIVQFALVEREHALVEVAVEVKRTNADVGARGGRA